MRTFAQQLVDFVTGLEKRFHCHRTGVYAHAVTVEEPQGSRFGIVDFWRTRGTNEQCVSIAFDSSNIIWWVRGVNRPKATCGISGISDLIGAIVAILSEVHMYFNIVELAGDLVRVEVFADTGCVCTEERNPVKVALITANQQTNLITEFQSLI